MRSVHFFVIKHENLKHMKGCIHSYTTIYTTQLYPSQLVTDIKCVWRDISTNSGSAFVSRADSPFEILKHWFSQLHQSKGLYPFSFALSQPETKTYFYCDADDALYFLKKNSKIQKHADREAVQCLFLEESRHLQHSHIYHDPNAINKDSHKPNMC